MIDRWIPEWAAVRSRAAAQPGPPAHRRPAPHRDRRPRRRAGPRTSTGPTCCCSAALLHDIGKVAGAHDHSAVGAPIAAAIVTRMGFRGADVEPWSDPRARAPHPDRPGHPPRPRGPAGPSTAVASAVGGGRDAARPAPCAHRGRRQRRRPGGLDRLAGPAARPARRRSPPALARTTAAGRRRRRDRRAGRRGDLVASVRRGGAARGRPHRTAASHRIDVFDRDRLGLFADTAGLLAAYGLVVRTAILRTYRRRRRQRVARRVARAATPPDAAALARGLAPPRRRRPLRRCSPWSGAGRPPHGRAPSRRRARRARRGRWSCRTPPRTPR